jgi:lactate permease
MYQQNYDPLGSAFLSTLVAAIPILVLLYFIALHRHRDPQGNVHLGISAPYAAFFGVIAAFLISCLVFRMPVGAAVSAFALGSLSGFLGIIWIVLAAMFLYTMSVVSGKFEIVKESIVHISFDRRLQCVLIAFSFGAIIEGTSGFGTPVAIAGAVMVGLGFKPFQSAVLNLLANTAPVAWGAIGTPIVTLAAVSGLDQVTLSAMAGRQLPFVSILVPFWLWPRCEDGRRYVEGSVRGVAGGAMRGCIVCDHAVFRLGHQRISLDDRCGSGSSRSSAPRCSCVRLASENTLSAEGGARSAGESRKEYRDSDYRQQRVEIPLYDQGNGACVDAMGDTDPVLRALGPAGIQEVSEQSLLRRHICDHAPRFAFRGTLSLPVWDMPSLHNLVQRMPPVAPINAKPEAARFTINWLSAAGTGVFVAAILTGLVLKLSASQWNEAFGRTLQRMKIPVLVIGQVLGLGFLTRYAGTDAVLGLAFTSAGFFYPFFAAYLGWLGVFLTGSDTASNALFGSLQRITAQQLNLNPILIVATNSTGGVMGKMIDAQSIMVACAACYDDPKERSYALGPIFRTVFWHSIAGAAVIGVIAMLQAYWFPG